MESLWNDQEADEYKDELGLRVYTSRLLGRNKKLVLHGGGNTSVKIEEKDVFGNTQSILYVKGSGWDLETIDRPGFAPVRLEHLVALSKLPALSDPQMVNELKTHMTNATAPTPSVEAILHATLPYKYVDHTHADAVVAVTNTPGGADYIKEIYGSDVVVIPYVMPGFDLARLCAREFSKQVNGKTIGMVLLNHGIFSFADSAKESYERMIELVSRAEEFLKTRKAWFVRNDKAVHNPDVETAAIVSLRSELSAITGFPLILTSKHSEKIDHYLGRDDLASISQQGPATPDHVIRTKRIPMLGREVSSYVREYQGYFEENNRHAKEPRTILDAAPRVVLDKALGLITVGRTAKDARVIQEIYQHTIDVIGSATALERFQALPPKDIFDVEYWDLEQAKLKKSGATPEFQGEVAMVTGAASGIGKACVDSLLARGATVVGVDIDTKIENMYDRPDYLGLIGDVSQLPDLEGVLTSCITHFGGLDILVLNAGIFPKACDVKDMDVSLWRKTMEINLDANLVLLNKAYPYLKAAPRNGRVVIIGSKNVPAPGPGAAAYSASKAALMQLMRVVALEWGKDKIRINAVHPNAVFDTAIWTDEVLKSRAESYGLTVEEYKKRNVMQVEVTSHDVAEVVAELSGALFEKTTAAQIPIDGGDSRVI